MIVAKTTDYKGDVYILEDKGGHWSVYSEAKNKWGSHTVLHVGKESYVRKCWQIFISKQKRFSGYCPLSGAPMFRA